MTYFVFDLINITDPDPDKYDWKVEETWIGAWILLTPLDNKYWYWEPRFTDSLTCASEGVYDEDICNVYKRTWVTNTLLNISLLVGVTLATFSLIWTFHQLKGYFHRMNVSRQIFLLFNHPSVCVLIEPIPSHLWAELHHISLHLLPDAKRPVEQRNQIWCGALADTYQWSRPISLLLCKSPLFKRSLRCEVRWGADGGLRWRGLWSRK